MKKIVIIIAILVIKSSMCVWSQSVHEFSGYLSGGFSPLSYQLSQEKFTQGDRSGGFGGEVGLGYTYFLSAAEASNMRWGVHSGLGLGFYNAKSNIGNGKTLSKNLTDNEGDTFEFRSTLSGYSETQNAMFLIIPLMAHAQIASKFYSKAGIKAGIPVSSTYKTNEAKLTNVAYFDRYNNIIENAKYAGIGAFDLKETEGTLDLAFAVMFALEAGMIFRITDALTLYAGAYFDYGLNNSLKTNTDDTFVAYNPETPSKITTNSILTEYTDKANVMAVGIRVRVGF